MARLYNGYSTVLRFDNFPGILLWEKTVTPSGWDGGGKIDLTGMRNLAMRTALPKYLVTLTDLNATVAWDSLAWDDFFTDLINFNGKIKTSLPDGASIEAWYSVNTFQPQEHKEGEEPLASLNAFATNLNLSFVEVQPVYSSPP